MASPTSDPKPTPGNRPYDLVDSSEPPKLPGTVIVRPDVDGVIDALAADMFIHARNCVRAFGDFHLALSGGSTPVPLYHRLMIDPNYREFPWARTHLWVVDERRVPMDDDRCNFKMIKETIVDHSGIPENQVHPIEALAPDADVRYSQLLQETLGWRERGHDRLDFVVLGMGADAHTASLFPQSPALIESLNVGANAGAGGGALVRINAGPKVTPPDRVTMMLPLLNASRVLAVLVTGAGKKETIKKLEAAERSPQGGLAHAADLPILGVRPIGGELRWYLDRAACP